MSVSTTEPGPVTEADTATPDEFDLDVRVLEVADPHHLINMTDDGCENTCEQTTCITSS